MTINCLDDIKTFNYRILQVLNSMEVAIKEHKIPVFLIGNSTNVLKGTLIGIEKFFTVIDILNINTVLPQWERNAAFKSYIEFANIAGAVVLSTLKDKTFDSYIKGVAKGRVLSLALEDMDYVTIAREDFAEEYKKDPGYGIAVLMSCVTHKNLDDIVERAMKLYNDYARDNETNNIEGITKRVNCYINEMLKGHKKWNEEFSFEIQVS